jgi:hypothetical protein
MDSKRDFPIVIGDKTYLLRYNFDALTAAEDISGKSFAQLMNGMGILTLGDVKTLFYAGLRKHHAEVTIEQVPAILDNSEDLVSLIKSLTDAMGNYFAKPKAIVKQKKTEPDLVSQTAESTTAS